MLDTTQATPKEPQNDPIVQAKFITEQRNSLSSRVLKLQDQMHELKETLRKSAEEAKEIKAVALARIAVTAKETAAEARDAEAKATKVETIRTAIIEEKAAAAAEAAAAEAEKNLAEAARDAERNLATAREAERNLATAREVATRAAAEAERNLAEAREVATRAAAAAEAERNLAEAREVATRAAAAAEAERNLAEATRAATTAAETRAVATEAETRAAAARKALITATEEKIKATQKKEMLTTAYLTLQTKRKKQALQNNQLLEKAETIIQKNTEINDSASHSLQKIQQEFNNSDSDIAEIENMLGTLEAWIEVFENNTKQEIKSFNELDIEVENTREEIPKEVTKIQTLLQIVNSPEAPVVSRSLVEAPKKQSGVFKNMLNSSNNFMFSILCGVGGGLLIEKFVQPYHINMLKSLTQSFSPLMGSFATTAGLGVMILVSAAVILTLQAIVKKLTKKPGEEQPNALNKAFNTSNSLVRALTIPATALMIAMPKTVLHQLPFSTILSSQPLLTVAVSAVVIGIVVFAAITTCAYRKNNQEDKNKNAKERETQNDLTKRYEEAEKKIFALFTEDAAQIIAQLQLKNRHYIDEQIRNLNLTTENVELEPTLQETVDNQIAALTALLEAQEALNAFDAEHLQKTVPQAHVMRR